MTETKEMVIRVNKSKVASLWNFKEGEIVSIKKATEEERTSFMELEKEKQDRKAMNRELKKLRKK